MTNPSSRAMLDRLFISYARDDGQWVNEFVHALNELRVVQVWWDQNLIVSQAWWDAILDEIERAGAMIALLSPRYISSPFCMAELSYAVDCHKPIIAFALKPIETLPTILAPIQFTDIRGWLSEKAARECLKGLFVIQQAIFQGDPRYDRPNPLPPRPPVPNAQASAPVSPADITALRDQVQAVYDRKDWDAAIALGKQLLQVNGTDPVSKQGVAEIHYQRGLDYHDQRDFARAILDFNRAIELVPQRASYYYSRGVSADSAGMLDQAIVDKSRAIDLSATPKAQYYWSRGASYDQKNDFERALADKSRAIELEPTDAYYYYSRGVTYYRKRDQAAALIDFNRAVELDPTHANYFYWRGMVQLQLGDKAAHKADLEQAATLGHDQAKKDLAAMNQPE